MRKSFLATSFFLVAAFAYIVCNSLGFCSVTIVNIFLSLNKIVLTSLDEYFLTTVSNG